MWKQGDDVWAETETHTPTYHIKHYIYIYIYITAYFNRYSISHFLRSFVLSFLVEYVFTLVKFALVSGALSNLDVNLISSTTLGEDVWSPAACKRSSLQSAGTNSVLH